MGRKFKHEESVFHLEKKSNSEGILSIPLHVYPQTWEGLEETIAASLASTAAKGPFQL